MKQGRYIIHIGRDGITFHCTDPKCVDYAGKPWLIYVMHADADNDAAPVFNTIISHESEHHSDGEQNVNPSMTERLNKVEKELESIKHLVYAKMDDGK